MLRSCISRTLTLIRKRPCLATTQYCPFSDRTFSDTDRKRKAENAARLRALRGRNKDKKGKPEVDYRLQKGSTLAKPKDLWGATETPALDKPSRFFDEVDSKMNKKAVSSIASLFEDLDRKQQEKLDAGTALFGSAPKSFFDAFPLEPKNPINPNAYEKECYDEYLEILNSFIESSRFTKKSSKNSFTEEFMEPIMTWLRRDEPTCPYNLPTLQSAIEHGINSVKADDLKSEMKAQQELFLQKVPLDKMQYERALTALVLIGNQSARLSKPLPLDVAWEKCKEAGVVLDEPDLNSYIFASTQFAIGSRRRRQGLVPANSILSILDPPHGLDDINQVFCNVPEEVATFRDVLYEPTEQSLTARVRALVAKGDGRTAQALLDASKLDELRHRTYQPILKIFLDNNQMADALSLLRRMQETHTCRIEPETYVQVIASMAEHGHFQPDAKVIDGIDKLGYSPCSGPQLLDQLVAAMADDVLEITSASARRLYSAFELANRGSHNEIPELHPLAPLQLCLDAARPDQIVASRVAVNTTSGECPRTKATLRLINLDAAQRTRLREGLLSIAQVEFKEFNKCTDGDKAAIELDKFAAWLDEREGPPFTAIIDGPNVAYFMQNFDEGRFNFHQLKFLLRALEAMGETPLVVLPCKYASKSFSIHKAGRFVKQIVSKQESLIMKELLEEGKLYVVPPKVLDDYFWMLASISDQITARKGESIFVQAGNPEGRWPGARPMLVSNDQMRDHQLELIEPRLFRRWYACHIVNYNFTGFVNDHCVDNEIGYSPADFYSREIQANPSPLEDGSGGSAGTAWHFPVEDWPASERFVLRLPHPSN